jgi:enterochelin esterase-like enzyme
MNLRGFANAFDYRSAVTGTARSVNLWLPPGYSKQQEYSTLYLLHGGGGDYLDWVQQGCANVILDNLHAAGRLAPMIVVMAGR